MLLATASLAPVVDAVTLPEPAGPPSVAATSGPDAATAAFDRLIAVYWSPRLGVFYARSDHRPRAGGTALADFWWSAQLWQVVMDSYERSHRASDRRLIDRVYDGFVARNPTFNSDFNDDRGWWALAATRAYQLTGERRYLNRAENLFAGIWRSWDSTYGGGLWWRRSTHDQKNVATNAPAAVTALRLFEITGDARYRIRGAAIFRWVDGHLRDGSQIDDHIEGAGRRITWQFTYNYGSYVAAADELNRLTHSGTYFARAVAVADRATADLAKDGILDDEGIGDAGGFKGIFVRDLGAFARRHSVARYLDFLSTNARVAQANVRSDTLWGPDWSNRPPAGAIESLTDHSAVALLLVAPRAAASTPAAPQPVAAPMPPAAPEPVEAPMPHAPTQPAATQSVATQSVATQPAAQPAAAVDAAVAPAPSMELAPAEDALIEAASGDPAVGAIGAVPLALLTCLLAAITAALTLGVRGRRRRSSPLTAPTS